MDYDVSISIGTTANLGDLTKANKAVQDLAKAAKQVPDSLLSGGVQCRQDDGRRPQPGGQEFHRDLPAHG